jgi:hypothetical protein
MSPSSWNHGYLAADSYTSSFFRKLAPAWLDYTTSPRGFQPPRATEGPFVPVLELGSGMGLISAFSPRSHPQWREQNSPAASFT